ncbi:MAG: CarD family transcriptional regulator, partial [Candidatus Veblenbacteria bacterium]|nr:CarD family transcriptional regulator [Candidatus Veblenbacteria bacterium]
MSTPILAPRHQAVKERKIEGLHSSALARRLARGPYAGLTLPTNLTAQAFLLAHLPPQALGRGVVWCLPTHRELPLAYELASWWFSSAQHMHSLAPELLLFPEGFVRWLALSEQQQPHVLLVATEHLNLALPSPQEFKRHTLKLTAGQRLSPVQVLKQLVEAGYEPGPLPDDTGWYVKRGGTITVAAEAGSWRLTWDNDRLEHLEEFNLATGLPAARRDELAILPRRLPPTPGISLSSYLTSQHTLIGGSPALWPKYPHRLPVNPTAPKQLLGSVPLFVKQWTELARWLGERAGAREQVVALTASPHRLMNLLPVGTALPQIQEVPGAMAGILTGFVDRTAGVHYLCDRELDGTRRATPRRHLAAYERLKPNDYLVHIDHGIGRFGGLVEKPRDGGPHEYFVVEYAEGDKLYVPIEHTDRLSRYLGTPHPALERLSSAHWFQVQKRIKAETAALARELLALYAKRHTQTVAPWQMFPEEELLAASFPYPLTPDQLKTWAEISADLSGTEPMDRLICGDVGFGKTELAVRAAARAVFNGYQVAVLAPTTILAQQHYDTFSERLSAWGVRLGLASRAQTAADIRSALGELSTGTINVIIGTHRLLAPDVAFHRLGLLVVDEEQRFGVKQKEHLKALKPSVHVLALSATPIPRTLNLAVSSLRDLSIILSPPAGRQAVTMKFVAHDDEVIRQAISYELKRHGQVYYLVPHVRDLPAAEARLRHLFPTITLDVVHGRKSPHQVALAMHRFDQGELQLLLATTIIENGLDLPNVNTLIVEQAESFGLADLYQLRGRVGRGNTPAYAYFLMSERRSSAAEKRLEALAQANELGGGMSLALKDLELRGAGAVLGREQHGHVSAVGLHLYGQLLAEAVAEARSGEPLPAIPEVRLNLPLEGRIAPALVPSEEHRIHLYQRLASVREPTELMLTAQELLGRPLGDEASDRMFKNLLTLLEFKLLAERARLEELRCQVQDKNGKFSFRFLSAPPVEVLARLTEFDDTWHKVE